MGGQVIRFSDEEDIELLVESIQRKDEFKYKEVYRGYNFFSDQSFKDAKKYEEALLNKRLSQSEMILNEPVVEFVKDVRLDALVFGEDLNLKLLVDLPNQSQTNMKSIVGVIGFFVLLTLCLHRWYFYISKRTKLR